MLIPNEIIEYFAAEDMKTSWLIHDVIKDNKHPINRSIIKFINSIDMEILDAFLADPKTGFLCRSSDIEEKYSLARMEVAVLQINNEVTRRRIDILCKDYGEEIPFPYNHVDLDGVTINKNYLVNLSDMVINRTRIERGKTVFQILPSLPQLNSMYWCKQHLLHIKNQAEIHIRLDPFMNQPVETYREPFYKMLVYGISLDWEDIANLKEDRHAQWMPDSLTSDIKFTDIVWSPRSDGVHFICEEVPKKDIIELRGSRYFHGIYNQEKKHFAHFDGAIRFYTDSEILEREIVHVRNGGKSGKRVKIFQVNGQVDRQTWCNIAASFFVWNKDIKKYFSTAI